MLLTTMIFIMLPFVTFTLLITAQLASSDVIMNCPCGREGVSTRIVNGSPVGQGKYPWMVALFKQNPSGEGYYQACGATLINDQWLLTAAHCVLTADPNKIFVVVSEVDIENVDEGNFLNVDKIWLHPDYKGPQRHMHDDIALLHLTTPISFTTAIAPICLPTKDMKNFNNLFNIGWGQTSATGDGSDQLLHIETQQNHTCKELYKPEGFWDKQICTFTSGRGSCKGDSGGPVSTRINGFVVQVGVNSWGVRGTCGKYPDVATRISEYLDDIYRVTAGSKWCRNPILNSL